MMNKEFVEKWIDALRSGKYKQGRYNLRYVAAPNDTRYCCLGVACDILAKEGVLETSSFVGTTIYSNPSDTEGRSSSLPNDAVAYIGIGPLGELATAMTVRDHKCASLSGLNDYAGASFEFIADLLQRHLDGEKIFADVKDLPKDYV